MTGGLVFDVDDTLYLERDYVLSGFRCVGQHLHSTLGVEGFTDRAWRRFLNGGRNDIFDRTLEDLGAEFNARLIAELVEVYRNHVPDIELLPDSRRCLEAVRSSGIAMGIVTDGPSSSQHAKIKALGLEHYAEVVVVTADLGPGRSKPHLAPFQAVQQRLGMEGPFLTYVADNPTKDFLAPARLGWRTLRVRREAALHRHRPSGPDVGREVTSLHASACRWLIGDSSSQALQT